MGLGLGWSKGGGGGGGTTLPARLAVQTGYIQGALKSVSTVTASVQQLQVKLGAG